MSDRPPSRNLAPRDNSGIFDELSNRVKLILRLMADRRISPLLKLLPLGSLIYLFVPDLAPGPVDDAAVIWLGAYLFVELCPPAIVEEHRRALKGETVIDVAWKEEEADEDAPGSQPPFP